MLQNYPLTERYDIFEEEISLIKEPYVQNWLKDALIYVPNYFFEISSSESLLHHPTWDLGKGGTVRHTKGVVKVAQDLKGTYALSSLDNDLLIFAAVMHDSFKYGITFDLREYPLHPHIPRAVLKDKRIGAQIDPALHERVYRAIESHMGNMQEGSWSLYPEEAKANLAKDDVALILHLADYMASRETYIDPRYVKLNSAERRKTIEKYNPFPDEILKGLIMGRLLSYLENDYSAFMNVICYSDGDLINTLLHRLDSLKSDRKNKYNYDYIIHAIDNTISQLQVSIDGVAEREMTND